MIEDVSIQAVSEVLEVLPDGEIGGRYRAQEASHVAPIDAHTTGSIGAIIMLAHDLRLHLLRRVVMNLWFICQIDRAARSQNFGAFKHEVVKVFNEFKHATADDQIKVVVESMESKVAEMGVGRWISRDCDVQHSGADIYHGNRCDISIHKYIEIMPSSDANHQCFPVTLSVAGDCFSQMDWCVPILRRRSLSIIEF